MAGQQLGREVPPDEAWPSCLFSLLDVSVRWFQKHPVAWVINCKCFHTSSVASACQLNALSVDNKNRARVQAALAQGGSFSGYARRL